MTSNSFTNILRLHDESVTRERIRTSLHDWAAEVMANSGLAPSAHHRCLLNNLQLIASGDIKRLMVLMPPGSAKSTYASVIFPIWWFIQKPQTSIIATSHTVGLVEHFSRGVQALIREYNRQIGFDLRENDHSSTHWRTTTGGEYFGTGIRGAVTGRRADLVIIDDPIKSMVEADSARQRQFLWDWFSSELMTRLKPGARIVVIMTRWHENDLSGRLLTQNNEDWTVLRLPALAELNDPLGRPPGAPLWPEWEDIEALKQKRAVVGGRVWSALFQQSPVSIVGSLFNINQLLAEDFGQNNDGTSRRIVRSWDLAATVPTESNDPDWTVGLRLSQTGARFVVEDIVRLRGDYRTIQDMITSVARTDGHSVVVSLPLDPGQAGKSQIGELSALLSGFRVYTSRERGSKWSRAMLPAAQLNAGNLAIRPSVWNQAFLDELSTFPNGEHDDQVDALSRAFITLADFPKSSRRIHVPFNSR